MLTILCDSREQSMLTFPTVAGVIYEVKKLDFGDYGCLLKDGTQDKTVFERKEIGDLFSNYTSNYEAEKAKWTRAHEAGYKFHLLIEASFSDVLKGHSYRKDGEWHESKKSGISMIRQLMSITRKYGVEVHYFNGRREMAMYIQEYFLVNERLKK